MWRLLQTETAKPKIQNTKTILFILFALCTKIVWFGKCHEYTTRAHRMFPAWLYASTAKPSPPDTHEHSMLFRLSRSAGAIYTIIYLSRRWVAVCVCRK